MPSLLRSYGDRKEDASTLSLTYGLQPGSPAAHKAYFGQHRVGELARRGSLDPHASIAGAC